MSKFTNEEKLKLINQVESGSTTTYALAKELNIPSQTIDLWRKRKWLIEAKVNQLASDPALARLARTELVLDETVKNYNSFNSSADHQLEEAERLLEDLFTRKKVVSTDPDTADIKKATFTEELESITRIIKNITDIKLKKLTLMQTILANHKALIELQQAAQPEVVNNTQINITTKEEDEDMSIRELFEKGLGWAYRKEQEIKQLEQQKSESNDK